MVHLYDYEYAEYVDDCNIDLEDPDDNLDILKDAFEKISELNILPGREGYNEYKKIVAKNKALREKVLNGSGKFRRV